jgi:hypothetical protein
MTLHNVVKYAMGLLDSLLDDFFRQPYLFGFNQSETSLISSTGHFNTKNSATAWSAGIKFNYREQELVSRLVRYVGSDSYGNAVGSVYAGLNKSTFLVRERSAVNVTEPPAILLTLLAFTVFSNVNHRAG